MTTTRRGRLFRCVYCGERCRGRACGDHRDLLYLDPYFVLSTSRGPYVRARKVNDGSAFSR